MNGGRQDCLLPVGLQGKRKALPTGSVGHWFLEPRHRGLSCPSRAPRHRSPQAPWNKRVPPLISPDTHLGNSAFPPPNTAWPPPQPLRSLPLQPAVPPSVSTGGVWLRTGASARKVGAAPTVPAVSSFLPGGIGGHLSLHPHCFCAWGRASRGQGAFMAWAVSRHASLPLSWCPKHGGGGCSICLEQSWSYPHPTPGPQLAAAACLLTLPPLLHSPHSCTPRLDKAPSCAPPPAVGQ